MSTTQKGATPKYSERLKDPRWQKKRLCILERDDWTCQQCGGRELTLNVHHTEYKRGAMPWEYEDTVFVTLCQPCHMLLGKGKRTLGGERYMFIFQETLYKLCCDKRMTGERLRVFGLLLGRCDWENWIYVSQAELARDAGVHINQVNRSMRFLLRVGVLLQGPSVGRSQTYKLNSHYGYKGKLVNLAQHRRTEGERL